MDAIDGAKEEFEKVLAEISEELAEESPMYADLLNAVREKLNSVNDSLPLGELKNIIIFFLDKEIEFQELTLTETRTVLEDIKSGRASDPDYKPPEIPTEQEAQVLTEEAQHHAEGAEKWLEIANDREGPARDEALRIAATHTGHAERAEAAARLRDDLSPDDTPLAAEAQSGGEADISTPG